MNYTEERLNRIFEKGSTVKGKNPDLYRVDCYGNLMYRYSYGLYSPMGWNVDHSRAVANGGTDHLNNLQPMNSRANSAKGNKR